MDVEEVQINQKGIVKFWQLVKKGNRTKADKALLATMTHLVWLHPLDYPMVCACAPPATSQGLMSLIEKGYAHKVDNSFQYMMGILADYKETELMEAFEVYRRVVRGEDYHKSDVIMAIDMLMICVEKDAKVLRFSSPLSLDSRISQVKSNINPTTMGEWSVVLDSIIQEIHFDPDLLRHHDRDVQPVITASIIRWLDHLAGKESSRRWPPFCELE